ncbi:Aldehyde dehydrogenase [Jannaschia seosinensis]|uniref:Aldehyde dehydrogenase n=1 Tax=Jannaschia seosinensis TaxID=313367 RepID=A0A0M7BDI6_9RHOB|nr:aldehyde dehydrogenase family protein [Jannaschia seosinensis]CUH40461.1 Aldehyde dehydrogenase [Jannaschia seosinensis]
MSGVEDVRAAYERLSEAFSLDAVPSVVARIDRLKALSRAIGEKQEELVAAVSADFNPRAEAETLTAELAFTQETIRHTIRNLPKWARPRRKRVLRPVPGRTEVWVEPKGVVGVLSPWNYPLQLALVPLIAAVAAGNRVLLKPSERSPHSAEALVNLIGGVFPGDEVAVLTGGPDVAEAVTRLALGHLFFTGSTATGRRVALAAAETLTPVTLELGGRSPAVALPGASPKHHARMIAWGAWLNAGQTCVAPNHLWVKKGTEDAWADALLSHAKGFFPNDYSGMIDSRASDRMTAMLDEATARTRVLPAKADVAHAPRVVIDPPPGSVLLEEEIFAPILPILTYGDPSEVIAAERGRSPLAAYVFDRDSAAALAFLKRFRSGGGMVNGTVLHLAAHDLPFGGIGESGYGAYHGQRGFREFSHERAIFTPSQGPWLKMLAPPYAATARKIFRLMAR